MTADEIRDMWLEFFHSKGHYIEPSANLIPHNDPTLLWINAGVAALKKYFDGSVRPEHRRITNAQKCIRTNDIENVGHTARHHTFFEMLGNFSIGDYFRPEVIPWACELLMGDKWFAFPKEKLYVTYYPDDLATRDLWIRNGMLASHLVPLASNFWEIGEGPCGPDTEIYFDRGESYDPEHKGEELLRKDEEHDRYIEIWNIVFSQYNAEPGKKRSEYKELPQKNIDTGAGLERLACVMQGVETNFDTDLFMPTINWISAHSDKPYDGKWKLAYRVVADHIRSVVFALADGAVFSNEGRGYVLRRLVRRAERYARELDLKAGTLAELVPVVVDTMDHYYPYLRNEQERVAKMILSEELRFDKTLNQGEKLLKEYLGKTDKVLSGADAFRLSDTYGFPIELTEEIAAEQGKSVDEEGFKKELQAQKERARAARGNRESFGSQSKDLLNFTEPSSFTYEEGNFDSEVIGLFKNGQKVDVLEDEGDVIVKKTNFYAESGGQVADQGTMENKNTRLNVTDVQKAPNGQYLHHVEVLYGSVKAGDTLTLEPDWERRNLIRKNHSSAHLLQAALQKYLGKDVHQAGSYEDDECVRFDFTYDKKLTDEELSEIEEEVNKDISAHIDCVTKIMPIEEADKTGAMHLFSEKYGKEVRVVSFGEVSKEFCAGTHVHNTRDIGVFAIVEEGALAAGVRRITGVTGLKAYQFLKEKRESLGDVARTIGVKSDKEVPSKLKAMNNEKEQMKNRIQSLEGELVSLYLKVLVSSKESLDKGVNLYKVSLKGFTHPQLLDLINDVIAKDPDSLVVVFNEDDSKGQVGVGAGKNAISKGVKSGNVVRNITSKLNGHGGGRPDMAFGGYTDLLGVEKVLASLKDLL